MLLDLEVFALTPCYHDASYQITLSAELATFTVLMPFVILVLLLLDNRCQIINSFLLHPPGQ